MKSVAFHLSTKIHHAFGLLLIETISARTIKNRPIWSHWIQQLCHNKRCPQMNFVSLHFKVSATPYFWMETSRRPTLT